MLYRQEITINLIMILGCFIETAYTRALKVLHLFNFIIEHIFFHEYLLIRKALKIYGCVTCKYFFKIKMNIFQKFSRCNLRFLKPLITIKVILNYIKKIAQMGHG